MYENIAKWSKKEDLLSFDLLLVPIFLSGHWMLCTIDLTDKKVYLYDSLMCISSEETAIQILSNLKRFVEEKERRKTGAIQTNLELQIMKDAPQQENGYDCGMFTILNARYLAEDMKPSYPTSSEFIAIFRTILACDIVRGQICE
jgi:sentrin-specific protease 1